VSASILVMSFGDYIQLKKMKQTTNNYPHFTSANYAQFKKMRAILNSCEDDDDGEELPPSYNTIPITDTVLDAQNFVIPCSPNTYTGPVTQPIYDKPPRITTPNVKTTKNSSCI
jgi:hypothetical protein